MMCKVKRDALSSCLCTVQLQGCPSIFLFLSIKYNHVFSPLPGAFNCCHLGTAVKHRVPDRVKPSFVFLDIRAL